MNTKECEPAVLDCGHPPTRDDSAACRISTGYGTAPDGKTACYECCAAWMRARMIETGRADLYLSSPKDGERVEVTDWPGHLRFRADYVRPTRIGFCLDGRIAYFTGPDGERWSARGPGLGMYARARRLAPRNPRPAAGSGGGAS